MGNSTYRYEVLRTVHALTELEYYCITVEKQQLVSLSLTGTIGLCLVEPLPKAPTRPLRNRSILVPNVSNRDYRSAVGHTHFAL